MASFVPAILDSIGLPGLEPAVVVLRYSSLAVSGLDPDPDHHPFASQPYSEGHTCPAPTLVAGDPAFAPGFDLVLLAKDNHTGDSVDPVLDLEYPLVYPANSRAPSAAWSGT